MVVDRPEYGGALLTIFDAFENRTEILSGGRVYLGQWYLYSTWWYSLICLEWSFQEESCWIELQPKKGFDKDTHVSMNLVSTCMCTIGFKCVCVCVCVSQELDLGDHLELEVWSALTELG